MGPIAGSPAGEPPRGDAGDAAEYRGYEALLALPDKERGDVGVLGWDARRMRRWLADLGLPQRRLRCSLVAGSKGKGSTAAMLAACLGAQGRRTGLYTQPHLHRYAERIRVDGRPLPAAVTRRGLRTVLAAAPGPVTAFEAATAYCLWAFAQAGVQEAVLEVGFGGRLDATAECDPDLVLLVPIEGEHADLLGPTLRDVAMHDVALCRYGRTCYFSPQTPPVAALLHERFRVQGCAGGQVAPPEAVGRGRLRLRLPSGQRIETALRVAGAFQQGNAALAAAGAAALGCTPPGIAAGLAAARWPGRFERVARRPEVIVDAAHTPMSAVAVRQALQAVAAGRPVALVVGMFADKDARGFAAAFAGMGGRVWATRPEHPRAMAATGVAAAFASACTGLRGLAEAPSCVAACAAACAWAGPGGVVLITGGHVVAAEARAHFLRR